MQGDLIEEIKAAVREGSMRDGDVARWATDSEYLYEIATAILPIIERARLEGVKVGLEAAAKVAHDHKYNDSFLDMCTMRKEHREDISREISALDPAAVVQRATAEPQPPR